MAKPINKLTVLELKGLAVGKHADGAGLYLEHMPNGSKIWRMKYRYAGKERRISFGHFPETSLAEARAKRDEARKLLDKGHDPVGARREVARARQETEAATCNTFEAVALEWLELKRGEWVASHYEKQAGRLRQAFPWIGHKAIATIGITDLRFEAAPALALSS